MLDLFPSRQYQPRHPHQSKRARIRTLILLSSLVSVVGVSALAAVMSDRRAPDATERTLLERAEPAQEPRLPVRTLFRHSVVPGGVLTADEVETAMGRDGIVAAHYSAINPRELRVETLPRDRAVYMSYRIGDEVFWTKQKVRLRQGETILTDGAHQIRTRCGNCIAFAPMAPTSDDEPGEMEFDALTDQPEVVQSRSPLGSELLFGPVGIPLPWLLGNSSDGFAGNEFAGSIGIPVFWYAADPSEPGLSGDDLVIPPIDEPASPGVQPADGPFTHPPPQDRHDPANPEQPGGTGNPGVPVVPGEHEVPLNPILPPLENPVVPVPEPATLLLIGGGLTALFARRQRL